MNRVSPFVPARHYKTPTANHLSRLHRLAGELSERLALRPDDAKLAALYSDVLDQLHAEAEQEARL